MSRNRMIRCAAGLIAVATVNVHVYAQDRHNDIR